MGSLLVGCLWTQQDWYIVYLIDFQNIFCKLRVAQSLDWLQYSGSAIGPEINAILRRYLLNTLLDQFKTFVIQLGDPPINEWIGVGKIGVSDLKPKGAFVLMHTLTV